MSIINFDVGIFLYFIYLAHTLKPPYEQEITNHKKSLYKSITYKNVNACKPTNRVWAIDKTAINSNKQQ